MFLDKLFKKKKNNFAYTQTTFGYEGQLNDEGTVEYSQDPELVTAQVGNFKIRTTRPSKYDRLASDDVTSGTKLNGVVGKSYCIVGKPKDSQTNVLSNCVGYACGRFNEIYSELTGFVGMKYPYLCNNAEDFISYCVEKRHPDLKPYVHMEPAPGGIGVQEGKGNLAGHVYVFEKQIDDTTWLISESAYNGTTFRTREITLTKSWDGKVGWGNNSNVKYLGCIHNPAVIVHDEDDPKVTDPVAKDTTKDQIKLTSSTLRVRIDGTLKAKVIGFCKKDAYYNFIETKKADGYTWYKIADNQWCADCGCFVIYKADTGLHKGDKVKIIASGNSRADGKGKVAGGVGWERVILADTGATYKCRYKVGTASGGVTGFYSAAALKKL